MPTEKKGHMLKARMKAPDFALEDQDGNIQRLSDYAGRIVVIYFYPKDFTPGCTMEGMAFRDNYPAVLAKNGTILGVNSGSKASHKRFRNKLGLPYPLLSDPAMETIKKYGALKRSAGKQRTGRCTFIIDERGRIAKIFMDVNPFNHIKEVLSALERGKKGKKGRKGKKPKEAAGDG